MEQFHLKCGWWTRGSTGRILSVIQYRRLSMKHAHISMVSRQQGARVFSCLLVVYICLPSKYIMEKRSGKWLPGLLLMAMTLISEFSHSQNLNGTSGTSSYLWDTNPEWSGWDLSAWCSVCIPRLAGAWRISCDIFWPHSYKWVRGRHFFVWALDNNYRRGHMIAVTKVGVGYWYWYWFKLCFWK